MKEAILLLFIAVPLISTGDILDIVRSRGLRGKITYRVIDISGNAISNASVSVCFMMDSGKRNIASGETDENGLFSAESRVNLDSVATIRKDGYYDSRHRHWFLTADKSRMEAEKWLPWNPMVEVVLRPVKAINETLEKRIYLNSLRQEITYGFDFDVGDILAPDGAGKHADVLISYERMPHKNGAPQRKLMLFFPSDGDGIIIAAKNTSSSFQFEYQAPLVGYKNPMKFVKYLQNDKDVKFPNETSEYLIFRVSRENEKSREVEFHYGRIDMLKFSFLDAENALLSMEYYYNGIAGNRSIEYAE